MGDNYQAVKKRLCRYCYRELYVSHIHLHEELCPLGPLGEEVKAFLQEHATDGHMMSTSEYNKRKPKRFPMHGRLVHAIGSWIDHVAPWAGLEYVPSSQIAWKYDGNHTPSDFVPEVEFIDPVPDPQGIPAGEWKVKRFYDWQRHAYITAEVAELR